MKYLKVIGLVALAVTAMMAVGASSASASAKICSTEGSGTACMSGHGNVYNGKVVATSSKVTLTATEPDNTTVECTSTTEGKITNGAEGTGEITSLTFANCQSSFCKLLGGTITASSPANWAATATTTTVGVENTNGTMDVTVNGFAGKFVCSTGPITCEYSATTPSLDITGSDTAPTLTATNIALTKIAGPETNCGKKADWSGTYNVSTPKSLFIE